MPSEIIDEASSKFIQKIIFNREPEYINSMIKAPRSRACADHTYNDKIKGKRVERSAIVTGISNYNRIPPELKNLPPKKLSEKLKQTKLLPPK